MLSDFPAISRRARIVELMDQPCTKSECIGCLADLAEVNRMLLAYRPTIKWLRQFACAPQRPLRIVDAGCGAGDMLRRIEAWAFSRKIAVELTGIDFNRSAVEAARQLSGPDSQIRWTCCDVLAFYPGTQVDLVISSLFAHNLDDNEIVRFLQWMETIALRGWFINDLERSLRSYYCFKLLARLMRWHPFVQHDGPVSILNSFTRSDWAYYFSEAGMESQRVSVFRAPIGRICVSRVK
jgi:SAM-dependent methyltransferase